MAKVMGKLQVTVPKALAAELDVRPGDDVDRTISGNGLRAAPAMDRRRTLDRQSRLRLFDDATERQRRRQQRVEPAPARHGRGWSREELYDRGRPG